MAIVLIFNASLWFQTYNFFAVSTISTGSDSSGCGCTDTTGKPAFPSSDNSGCVDCVTVVSVPDNQVITQGVNHRCSVTKNSSPSPDEKVIDDLTNEINRLRKSLEDANEIIKSSQHGDKNNSK